jgi:hypothetical protein
MAAKEHKERKELLAERGCVRSTSRSMSDISSVVLTRTCCGWVCDHSRAPLRSLRLLVALSVLVLSSLFSYAEDLTTLDGKTFTNITEVTKYPKLIVFTCNSNRTSVAISNLSENFRVKYGITIQTNSTSAASIVQANPDDILLAQNEDLFECDQDLEIGFSSTNLYSEKNYTDQNGQISARMKIGLCVTNRYSGKVYTERSWQMCLRGVNVRLAFSYMSEDETNMNSKAIHFTLGQQTFVNQAFDKFIEWNGIAVTNKAEPFEKIILQSPDPDNVLNSSGVHQYIFRWDFFNGGELWDSSASEGGFDNDSVVHFQVLMKRLPDLKAKLLEKIRNRNAQQSLFK